MAGLERLLEVVEDVASRLPLHDAGLHAVGHILGHLKQPVRSPPGVVGACKHRVVTGDQIRSSVIRTPTNSKQCIRPYLVRRVAGQ
jgi:hypothetical protein